MVFSGCSIFLLNVFVGGVSSGGLLGFSRCCLNDFSVFAEAFLGLGTSLGIITSLFKRCWMFTGGSSSLPLR